MSPSFLERKEPCQRILSVADLEGSSLPLPVDATSYLPQQRSGVRKEHLSVLPLWSEVKAILVWQRCVRKLVRKQGLETLRKSLSP